jgi:hypothetical protein
MSVEGIWEGLKVFEKEGPDVFRMTISNYKGLKRNGAGAYKGHSAGSDRPLLNQREARKKILLPAYRFVLKNYCESQLNTIKEALKEGRKVVIVDRHSPADIYDESKPISYGVLLKYYLLDKYPH